MRHLYKFFILAALFISSCTKEDKAYRIAVFEPFSAESQRAGLLNENLKKVYGDTAVFAIDEHHLAIEDIFFVNSDSLYLASTRTMLTEHLAALRKEQKEPDLIVLYGDWMAHAAAQLNDPWLQEKPVVCIAVIDAQYKGLLKAHNNFTVMELRPGIKETVDMIRDMGAPSWIVTTLDSGYVDNKLRKEAMIQLADTSHYRADIDLSEPDTFQTIDL